MYNFEPNSQHYNLFIMNLITNNLYIKISDQHK